MTNPVLILMLASCGDLIVKNLMKLLVGMLENHLEWNKIKLYKLLRYYIFISLLPINSKVLFLVKLIGLLKIHLIINLNVIFLHFLKLNINYKINLLRQNNWLLI